MASVSEDQIKKMLEDLDIKYKNTYDDTLSLTSTNAVQNQAVTKKFKKLDDKNTRTDNELTNIKSSVNTALSNSKSYTDSKISDTKIQIDSEITKIDNKIKSEISRAQASETNLSNRIDNLEEDVIKPLNEAKEYTDALANGEVKNNTNKLNILNGTGEGSVIKTVKDEISNLVGTAPEKLDTLQEIADYLEEHEDMASGLVNSLSELEQNKVDKVPGKGLSMEDYTTEEKNKLAGLNNYDDTAIAAELSKKVNKSDLATINGQRIDEGGNIEIEGGGSTPDLSGYLTKEEFNKASEDFATTDALEGKQDTIEDLNSIRSGAEKGATAVQPSILEDYATTQQLTELSEEIGKKQDTISDLETIRSGATKGATALQSVPATYATKADVSNAIQTAITNELNSDF